MTDCAKSTFDALVANFTAANPDVEPGPMMSSPGLKCRGKVFAFLWNDNMGFRLGPAFDPAEAGIENPMPLNPFKTKGPLKGWWVIGEAERDKWVSVADQALAFTRTL